MLNRFVIGPDSVRRCAEAAAGSMGSVTGILLGAVRDITEEISSLATELVAITDAAVRAADDD